MELAKHKAVFAHFITGSLKSAICVRLRACRAGAGVAPVPSYLFIINF